MDNTIVTLTMKDSKGREIKIGDEVLVFSTRAKILHIRFETNERGTEPVAYCRTLSGTCNAYSEEIQKVGK